MNRRLMALVGLLLSCSLFAPAAARAASAPPPPALAAGEVVWHIVRPGETLELIAARYLGSSQLWKELHRLNPEVVDPNRIEPGQRIRVPIRPAVPAATVARLSRQVEEQPSPIAWTDARQGDLLVERDGVRTFPKSSAELRFADGARLTVTEESLVFLRRSGTVLKGVERKSIELMEGQAELDARTGAPAAAVPEVEIIAGASRTTSRPDKTGGAQTRARRAEAGSAKVMVYGGESEVEAGGAKVAVPRGMGTSVAASGPPSPPEKLLPAPAGTDPAAGAERACADPLFTWQVVPEAASYTVEVCRDAACAELVERQTGDAESQWRPTAPLPVGDYFWRVTARSRSGLDGYPSEGSRLAVTSSRTGVQAPSGSIAIGGPQVRVGERLFTSAAATVQVTATAPDGTPARFLPVIGGQEAAAWPDAWPAGEHTAGAIVLDGCGHRVPLPAVPFVTDTAAPAIRWQVGDQKSLSDRLAPDTERDRRRLRNRRSGGKPATDAWQTLDGVWQVPVPWVKEKHGVYAQFPVEIRSDRPQAFLEAPETTVTADGKDAPLGGHILWIAVEDAGAGVDRLILRDRTEADRVVLEVEAIDLVGNSTKKEIVLRKRVGTR
ncbi:MAG TPA: LysM peptidoglycan-binding domain-containing protein [Thermoanaerobaculia bacterium]|nr:LysM peptidoglycan-binding domain-containing protein [Thermoanaerobaculia bacterium]